MSDWLLLYEDGRWRELSPLADLTPVPELAFGASTVGDRWQRAAKRPLLGTVTWMRVRVAAAQPNAKPRASDDVLIANAAALPGSWLQAALADQGARRYVCDGRIAAVRAPFSAIERAMRIAELFGTVEPANRLGDEFEPFLTALDVPSTEVVARFLARPWDVVALNPEALMEDLESLETGMHGDVHALVALYAPGEIGVEAGARVDALAVLDARSGPIHIGAGAVILPHTVVAGPCVIGAGTQLLGGCVGGSTIGPGCRIAGEVDACVWQGWSNKRHHGFVGHSVVGEWANLGALTTTSDLKNNYGSVRVWSGGEERDSGLAKVGSFIGAHVKTGIGTLLPTGASIGVGSNLFGGGRFAPKYLPAFSWWDGERVVAHELDKFMATARTAMSRRERELSSTEEAALRRHFEGAAAERRERNPAP